ncbi:TolC family protein [Myxococcota bacterium]|nr:TolC family protein [Myxococcota bacterium]
MKGTVMVLATGLLLGSWSRATAQPLTIEEAIREALARNPQVVAAREGVQAAAGRRDQAVARWIPSLSGTASYTRQTGNFAPRPGLSLSNLGAAGSAVRYRSVNDSYDYYAVGLSLQQNIWDFGRTLGVHRQASAGIEAAREDLRAARTSLWALVVERFHGVLAAEEIRQVARRSEEQARRHLELAQARVEAGTRSPIDRVRAQAELEGARAALVAAEDGVSVAREALAAAIGRPDWADRPLVAPDPGAPSDLPEADAVWETARQSRPDRSALESRIRAQRALVQSVQGNYWPILSWNAFFNDAGLRVQDMVWNWGIGATLTVPLLAAPGTAGQVREARAVLAALEAQLAALDLQVRMEVRQALSRVRDARKRLEFLQAQAALGREALALAEGRYEAGAGTLLELLDARTALENAEAQEVQGRLDQAVAEANLVRVSGRLPVGGTGGDE